MKSFTRPICHIVLCQISYPDNFPPGQFPNVQVLVLIWWVVLFRGSGSSGELSWWGIVLGIVVPVGNGLALFFYQVGNCPSRTAKPTCIIIFFSLFHSDKSILLKKKKKKEKTNVDSTGSEIEVITFKDFLRVLTSPGQDWCSLSGPHNVSSWEKKRQAHANADVKHACAVKQTTDVIIISGEMDVNIVKL